MQIDPPQGQLDKLVKLYHSGKMIRVIHTCKELLTTYKKSLVLFNILGSALQATEKFIEAVDCYNQAIQINPDYVDAYGNRGNALKELGRLDEAIKSYNKVIQLNPNYAEAYGNRGNALNELGQSDEAIKNYKKAIQLKPDYVDAYNNLGGALKQLGRLDEAIKNYKKAIQLKPDYVNAYINLGGALQDQGQLDKAVEIYNKAIQLNPNDADAHSNRCCVLNYFSKLTQTDIFQEHLKFEKQFGLKTLKDKQATRLNKNTRLRVGYISGDFNSHSVGYFFEPLLKSHSRSSIEVYCYYSNIKKDETTKRLIDTSEHWRSIGGMNDDNLIDLIRKDNIDILVDLSGHTSGNRLTIFPHKPAPIQVTWLGYPNTTGLSSIDYRFTDEIADPIGKADELHSEELVRLPNGFLCYQGDESMPVNTTLPYSNKGHITFGNFNNLTKTTPQVVKVWSQILKSIPDSRLLLKAKQLSDSNTKSRYLELFEKEGIPKDRLELHSWLPEKDGHFRLYDHVDIGLDPFPYNGTTTTCEALWMGVPVITMCGDRHSSRVGASILTHVGLEKFIATDVDGYINMAIEYANNIDSIKSIRTELRHNMQNSDLCNANVFTGNVEQAYQNMYSKLHIDH
ncbi:MAG: tetratricopeptide repeat protein [Candidatus Thioglobus sp.]|nr:tetratricopeptide repeat protein [Candidatus Thioglobus sp.]